MKFPCLEDTATACTMRVTWRTILVAENTAINTGQAVHAGSMVLTNFSFPLVLSAPCP